MAGWRVGVVHSRNTDVLLGIRGLLHQCEASTVTLRLIAEILCPDAKHTPSTDGGVQKYLAQHRQMLRRAAHDVCIVGLCSLFLLTLL